MTNHPKVPAPQVQCAIIIQGMSNGGLNIQGSGNLDLDLDLILAAANSLHQERKKRDKPIIEPVSLAPSAIDIMNGGRAR